MQWTKAQIINYLNTNDKVLYGALVALYNEQTADEKCSESTNHLNGRGFNGADAKILSSMAKQVMVKRCLTEKQTALVRKKIMKYANQLTLLSNEKAR